MSSKTTFVASAIASGLVSKSDLDAALASLRAPGGNMADEERLAAKLVEIGRLNVWQAGQLLTGRTKFTLGWYQILDSIGQGGMGHVFKAEHTIMRRIVAIKVLPREKSTPEAIANFGREIQAQAQLDHENLVRALDAGHDGNVHFLVTEYVPGTDLRKHIRRNGKLNMRAAAAIICQAARGLQHAHQRGLIHRDVKPGNLLVTPDGHTKVSDLGLAGYLDDDDGMRDARNGKIVGTADYLSPEQILSPEKVGPASDVYALGCTLYYAITGKVPFPGGTPREKAMKHCKQEPMRPQLFNAELDDRFTDALADMMAKDPAKRLPTAASVIERLSPWAGENWRESAKEVGALAHASTPLPGCWPSAVQASNDDLLEDTRPVLDNPPGPAPNESGTQSSQTTHPLAAVDEETLWSFDMRPKLTESGFSTTVLVMIAIGLTAAAAVLIAVMSSVF